jgi:DNA-binding CsgD family transcriptional regulator
MTQVLMLLQDDQILLQSISQPADVLAAAILTGKWPRGLPARYAPPRCRWRAFCISPFYVVLYPDLDLDAFPHQVFRPASLSPRQTQVLNALVEGLTVEQIAARLSIRPRTVSYHIQCIKQKLGSRLPARGLGFSVAGLEDQRG